MRIASRERIGFLNSSFFDLALDGNDRVGVNGNSKPLLTLLINP
jgi:hypothetical protein